MTKQLASLRQRFQNLTPEEILAAAVEIFGEEQLAFACSFSLEDVMILDIVQKNHPHIKVFTLDTGRLPEATYRLWEQLLEKYPGLKIHPHYPDLAKLESFIAEHGPNAFHKSTENRKACCAIRKVDGLKRAIAEKQAWITGLRSGQSAARETLEAIETDSFYSEKFKISPLAFTSSEAVIKYTESHGLPKNELYDQGYTSIGCAPCTRAIQSGEHERAGRWWWESPEKKECGLHPEFYEKKIIKAVEQKAVLASIKQEVKIIESPAILPHHDPRLDRLENESIFILREAYKQIGKIALLWSIGKDSGVLLHLIRKAFFGHVPIPLIHVDTSFKLPEMIEFRDRYAKEWNLNLIVHQNTAALRSGMNHTKGRITCCKALKADPLKAVIREHGFKALIAGIRRDEEGSRSKERYFSPRGKEAQWNYKNQPPEFWGQFQTDFGPDAHVRIHPILHWNELDVWEYIKQEGIPVVSLYFSKNGKRYRSLGCAPCTDPIDSDAKNLDDIIAELKTSTTSERDSRAQDREDAHALQKLRADGYM